MDAFKATAEAGVAVASIAIAIARHLVKCRGNLDRCFVRFLLRGLSQAFLRELSQSQDRGKCFPFGRCSRVKRRRWGLTSKLCVGYGSSKNNGGNAKKVFHNALFYLRIGMSGNDLPDGKILRIIQ